MSSKKMFGFVYFMSIIKYKKYILRDINSVKVI